MRPIGHHTDFYRVDNLMSVLTMHPFFFFFFFFKFRSCIWLLKVMSEFRAAVWCEKTAYATVCIGSYITSSITCHVYQMILLYRIIPKWRTVFSMRLKWMDTSSHLDRCKCGLKNDSEDTLWGGDTNTNFNSMLEQEIKLPKTGEKQSKLKPSKCSVKVLFIIGLI